MLVKIQPENCNVENSNHYFGYSAVSTNKGKSIYAKGAPRLYQLTTLSGAESEDVIINPENAKLAVLIRELVKCDDISKWGDYLTGNFILLIVDGEASVCYVIVDLGNSFHLYNSDLSENEILFSTDIDRLAYETSKNNDLDYVSIVEYLTHQSMTYPHTFYNDLSETSFATCITINFRGMQLETKVHHYWSPGCTKEESSSDIEGLAEQLRTGVLKEFETIISDKENVGLFMSGGSDSRVLAGLMKKFDINGLAITVSDENNPEVEIARRVAEANGLRHEVLLRDMEYYPKLIKDGLELEGPHLNFTWQMFLGFREKIKAFGFDALFGVYMSDTLLKLHEANVTARYFLGRYLGTLEIFDTTELNLLRGGTVFIEQFSSLFKQELLDQVNQRRKNILEYWNSIREDGSAWEWSYMWPFTRNKHNSNLTTHIFHYPSYEIMTCRSVIEVARVASQKIKINGRLFNKAMFPLIRHSKSIPIANNMIRPTRFQRWDELRIAVKHILPHRLFLRQQAKFVSDNPVATHRCTTNLRKVWEISTVLERLRREYPTSDVTKGVLKKDVAVFDKRSYGSLATNYAHHIMYTFLYLNAWRKLGK